MLWSLFENPAYFLLMIPAVLIALVVHEVSHGYAAYLCGDNTAKAYGRLTLNPLKHLAPFGAIMMMLTGFGYAKPVPYNPRYFKDPRRDDVIVGLAGPSANLAMAALAAAVAWGCSGLVSNPAFANNELFAYFYVMFLPTFALINLYLMFFNLLPIPPLDGSSIFAILLPPKYLPKYYQIQQYAFPVFMIAIVVLPYVFNFNPFSWYLGVTAGNLFDFMFPPFFS